MPVNVCERMSSDCGTGEGRGFEPRRSPSLSQDKCEGRGEGSGPVARLALNPKVTVASTHVRLPRYSHPLASARYDAAHVPASFECSRLAKAVEAKRLVVMDEVGNIALLTTVDQCATMRTHGSLLTEDLHRMDGDRPRRRETLSAQAARLFKVSSR